MTEAEAKTKWCFLAAVPMETSGVGIGIAINRNADGSLAAGTLCLASDCMAWRVKTPIDGYCGVANPKGTL